MDKTSLRESLPAIPQVAKNIPYVCRPECFWPAIIALTGIAAGTQASAGKIVRGTLIPHTKARIAFTACLVGLAVLFRWNARIYQRAHATAAAGDFLMFATKYGWAFNRLTTQEKKCLQVKFLNAGIANERSLDNLKQHPAFLVLQIALGYTKELSLARKHYLSSTITGGYKEFEELYAAGKTEYLYGPEREALKKELVLADLTQFVDGTITLKTLLERCVRVKNLLEARPSKNCLKRFSQRCARLTKKELEGIPEEVLRQLKRSASSAPPTPSTSLTWTNEKWARIAANSGARPVRKKVTEMIACYPEMFLVGEECDQGSGERQRTIAYGDYLNYFIMNGNALIKTFLTNEQTIYTVVKKNWKNLPKKAVTPLESVNNLYFKFCASKNFSQEELLTGFYADITGLHIRKLQAGIKHLEGKQSASTAVKIAKKKELLAAFMESLPSQKRNCAGADFIIKIWKEHFALRWPLPPDPLHTSL